MHGGFTGALLHLLKLVFDVRCMRHKQIILAKTHMYNNTFNKCSSTGLLGPPISVSVAKTPLQSLQAQVYVLNGQLHSLTGLKPTHSIATFIISPYNINTG